MKTWIAPLHLALWILPATGFAQITTTPDGNGGLIIAKYAGSESAVSIPSTIDGLPVTCIGTEAFARSQIGSLTVLPDSGTGICHLNRIGDRAFFACTSLSSVTIPDSVLNIGEQAFRGCNTLASISVSAQNKAYSSADGALFNQGQTTLIECPEGKVGVYKIPSSVTIIGNQAFLNCNQVTGIIFASSVTSIGKSAFANCKGLVSVTIGNGVTSVADSAFESSNLTSVTIPNNVTSLGKSVFENCLKLNNVTIGNGVTAIGTRTFHFCQSLPQITIPTGVTSIGPSAFENCKGLTSVTIPNGVVSIGDQAFLDCNRLADVAIPKSVASIGYAAFSRCANLKSVSFASGLTSIGQSAFDGCKGLTTVTIPNSVTSVGQQSFDNCPNLTRAVFAGDAPTMGWRAFNPANGFAVVYQSRAKGFESPVWRDSFGDTYPAGSGNLPSPTTSSQFNPGSMNDDVLSPKSSGPSQSSAPTTLPSNE